MIERGKAGQLEVFEDELVFSYQMASAGLCGLFIDALGGSPPDLRGSGTAGLPNRHGCNRPRPSFSSTFIIIFEQKRKKRRKEKKEGRRRKEERNKKEGKI